MKTAIVSMFAALMITTVAGCAADTGAEDPQGAAATDASELRSGDIVLRNKADRTVDKGPDKVTVSASAGNVTAKVTDSSLATCTIKRLASGSTSKKTDFSIAIDYQLDSGWNGCTIEFSAPGYKSTLQVGLSIND